MDTVETTSLTRFDANVRDAERVRRIGKAGRIVTVILGVAVIAATILLAPSLAGWALGLIALAPLGAASWVLSGVSDHADELLESAVRIAEGSPEVLANTETYSPRVAEALAPRHALTTAQILSYRTRVANATVLPGDFFGHIDALLAERTEEVHALAEANARDYLDGRIEIVPEAEFCRAEIDRIDVEFMAALTGPENRIAGDPLSDTTCPEVAALYDALAEAHAASEDDLPARARALSLAWKAAQVELSAAIA